MNSKALFIFPDAIGDFLIATPFLENFKKAHPDTEIHVLAGPRNIGLVSRITGINKALLFDRSLLNALGLIKKIRRNKYSLLIDLWSGSFPKMLRFIVKHSGIAEKIALEKTEHNRKLRYADCFDQIFPFAEGIVSRKYNNMAAYLGIAPVEEPVRYTYVLDETVRNKAIAYAKEPYIVLVCDGSRKDNTIPAEMLAETARLILRKCPCLNLYLTAAPGKNNAAVRVKSLVSSEQIFAVPEYDNSLDFTAALIESASVLVSTGTGSIHIGSAFNTPTVGIYPKAYNYFHPTTDKRKIIYSFDEVDSFPISAEEVAKAVRELYASAVFGC